ncbi:hypothetical protein [Deinococcus sp. Leaf326]|uniref:hypothetical protein n=1 Tax=Deinococcus sp. Leaf326 TaxID=1736338 RepID=UPI000B0AA676|nr:hypothetical protein [Deinococcus sp. Leaf326]
MSGGEFVNARRVNFTMLQNSMLRNPKLSLKAKGLLGLMLSFPDDWVYHMEHIETLSDDGRDAHRSALKELLDFGYVVRQQTRNEKGHLSHTKYEVSDTGWENHDPARGETVAGKSVNGKAVAGKSPTTNTDSTKTERTKTENPPTPQGKQGVELPTWLSEEAWGDFLTYRKELKAPVTPLMAKRLLAKLETLRAEGHDPVQVIDQTISTGKWTGLFPVKNSGGAAARRPTSNTEANQQFMEKMARRSSAFQGVFDE